MAKYRQNRINEAVAHEIGAILNDVKDPRVSGSFITVTSATVTPDLKYAKIYYSHINEADEKELKAGLKSATGYVRRELAQRLNLRITPELTFIRDEGAEKGNRIAELMHKVSLELDEIDRKNAGNGNGEEK